MLACTYTFATLTGFQRYVKQQITRQLHEVDNEFISFVMMAGVLGCYSDCKKRAPIEVVFDIAENGNAAIVSRLEPLSSRELFLVVCEFLVRAGDRWTILKTLCNVSSETGQQALEVCDATCRPKLFWGKSSRSRKQTPAVEEEAQPLPTLATMWRDCDINRKVPHSIISKLGGPERTGQLYRKFMHDAKHLPRGLMLKRKREPDSPYDDNAERLLQLHATRDALSLAIVPMCGQVVNESRRRLDPTYIAICTTCSAIRTRAKGGTNSKRAHGVEIDLEDGTNRCSNCQKNTIKFVDGRGKIIVAYARSIDRMRMSFTVCTFCGIFCVFKHRHLIYPACEKCANSMKEKPKMKCGLCQTRLQVGKDSYMPIQIQMKPRPKPALLCTDCFTFCGRQTVWREDDLRLLSQQQRRLPTTYKLIGQLKGSKFRE